MPHWCSVINRRHGKSKLWGFIWCSGIVKKQCFRSAIRISQLAGIILRDGIPGWRAPMLSMDELFFLESWSNLHLPDFYFVMNTGVFQGLIAGSMCLWTNCFCTKDLRACNFSFSKGRCGTHTSWVISHFRHSVGYFVPLKTLAPVKNLCPLRLLKEIKHPSP